MKIQSQTNNHCAPGTISTTVERSLQISPFLTNKANFPDTQMNVSNLSTMNYDKTDTWSSGKNKPNTNPIQTQFKPNTKPIQSQYKPKTNPKQTEFQRQKHLVFIVSFWLRTGGAGKEV